MDTPIRTARLVLSPVEADDADEPAVVFADERLYAFTGGGPGTVEELRGILGRLARDRAADPWAQRNWTVRRLADHAAVGMLQAVFGDGGRSAEIAWLVGVPWQGQGLASEAATAVVAWLEAPGSRAGDRLDPARSPRLRGGRHPRGPGGHRGDPHDRQA